MVKCIIAYCKKQIISEYPFVSTIELAGYPSIKSLPLIIDRILPGQIIVQLMDNDIVKNIFLVTKTNNLFPIYGKTVQLNNIQEFIDIRQKTHINIVKADMVLQHIYYNLNLSELINYETELQALEYNIKEYFLQTHRKPMINNKSFKKQITKTIKHVVLCDKIIKIISLLEPLNDFIPHNGPVQLNYASFKL